jgi:hypothetical protein
MYPNFQQVSNRQSSLYIVHYSLYIVHYSLYIFSPQSGEIPLDKGIKMWYNVG